MQVLIPISGRTSFFPQDEYFFPKPLIEIEGQPMIELVVNRLKNSLASPTFIFVIDRDDARTFSLDRTLRLAAGSTSKIIERPGPTSGALCSSLLAIDDLDLDAPLLISNSDQVLVTNLQEKIDLFCDAGADAGTVTFDSVHPRWSYVVDGGNNLVVQAVEKKVVSRNAIAGVYWFKTARLFVQAARNAILNDANVNGQFFISAALNEAILLGAKVCFQSVEASRYHSFYSPALIKTFEKSKELSSHVEETNKQVQLVIPAAGEGSRFSKAGWQKPKPFIGVGTEPMLNHVIKNVSPSNSKVTVLLRESHMEIQPNMIAELGRRSIQIVPVQSLTEGTASTVLLARRHFDNHDNLLIANSDQLVDFEVNDFVADCKKRNLDGSILVFRDEERNPKWSFAKVDDRGFVTEVAEKKPISDLATVGIYLFARGSDFVSSAIDMIVRNDRVNDEFYTCPVYNYMIANGQRIGVYEVPATSMHGLGTPDDLDAYLESKGLGQSPDGPRR